MATWDPDATSGAYPYTLSAAARTVFALSNDLPARAAIKLQLADPDDEVKVYLFGSDDGRTCYEVGIEGTDVLIREVLHGIVGATPDGDADDIPSTDPMTVAHGLNSGEPYTMEVRLIDGDIEVRFNGGSGAPLLSFTATKNLTYTGYGFVAENSGAVVANATVSELSPQISSAADILVMVCGGDVSDSLDGVTWQLVRVGAFPADATVDMDEFNGLMLMVGGGKAYEYDPQTRQLTGWTETNHPDVKLPGATESGTTNATGVFSHRVRAGLFGFDDDPQNIAFSAVTDHRDFDNGADQPGQSWTLGGYRAAKVGKPVVAVCISSNAAIIAGCVGAIYQITGDPAISTPDTTPVSLDAGVSHKNAMALVSEGVIVAHSPKGFLRLAQGNNASNISEAILTEGIQGDFTGYSCTVIRDSTRHGVHIFLTPPTGVGTHFWYDERVGRYSPTTGGFFPEEYPEDLQPTCACEYKGVVFMGTRGGYVTRFSDDAKSDNGEPIESYMTMQLLDAEGLSNDAEVNQLQFLLSTGSDRVTLDIYGARTPEDVYDDATRKKLYTNTITKAHIDPIPIGVRGRAMVAVISGTATEADPEKSWVLEKIEGDLTIGEQSTTTK